MLKKLGLGIVLATSFMMMSHVQASTTTNLGKNDFSQAKLASTKGGTLFDGNKLHFQDEQDQLIFSDDFSSNDFSKWSYNGDTSIVKDGSVNAAVFSKGSEIDLGDLKELNSESYYRVTYDVKFENYNDQSDGGTIRYYLGNSQITSGSIPIKVGQWQHVEDVYLSVGDTSNNFLRILGPGAPETAGAKMYITNFKIYKVSPTYTEDFSDGKIDSRFSTNSNFDYSVIDNNGAKALKVELPQNSLAVGTFENVLTAKETLAPAWYDPQEGAKQEGVSYLTHQAVAHNDSSNTSIIRNSVTDDHGQKAILDYYSPAFQKYPAFAAITPTQADLLVTSDTTNSTEVTYGVSAGASSVNSNKETLYIKDIQMYKGVVETTLNTNNIKRVVSTH
ncbi:hypothetical protein [Lactococcus lactis]|uniref:hypothetical protein n=1 Tax=Lactococcus lactis TaxID=1358 RepID=UPI0019135B7D|nr:hypothetical protein [Lactococcus lactis]WDA67575.1 hypothetical protein IL310_01550 [Lactococcus lactis]